MADTKENFMKVVEVEKKRGKVQQVDKVVYQYLRNANGGRVGMVVGFTKGENVMKIGVSFCNPLDKFDRETGLSIAIMKAIDCEDSIVTGPIPNWVEAEYLKSLSYGIQNVSKMLARKIIA